MKGNKKKNSKKNNNKQERKHREIYVVLLLLLGISVGFSYLSSQLDILGNTTIKRQNWDVHFEGATESTAVIPETNTPVADLGEVSVTSGKTTEVKFNTTLPMPGDYYEFTVTVKNGGSIPAMITETGSSTELTTAQKKYMTYDVTYADGSEIKVGDAIRANSSITIKVKVSYKKDVAEADLPTTDTTFSSSYTMKYEQADSTANYKA